MPKKKIARKRAKSAGTKKAVSPRKGKRKRAKTTKAEGLKPIEHIEVTQMPIKRHLDTSLQQAVFANHIVIRNEGGSCFQLMFFEAQPPVVVEGDPEELRKEAESSPYVDATCVSRVIIPAHVMPGLIRALEGNFQKHQVIDEAVRASGATSIEDMVEKAQQK